MFIVCSALAVFITLAGCLNTNEYNCADTLGCVTIAPGEPIDIGVLQVLSGDLKNQGIMQVRGVEMCLAAKNNRLLGHPVQL